jgi:glycosyltransferase involved in cell wall biosynthesis
MKILILYHSDILTHKPGADEHVYTTAKLLSEKNEVVLFTWGTGSLETHVDGNLTIIHNGNNQKAINSRFLTKFPKIVVDFLSYMGIYPILFLDRAKGPSTRIFRKFNFKEFDIAIRISFDNNRIPKYLSKHYKTKIVELAIVGGLPHYLENAKNWMNYIATLTPISFNIFRQLHNIMEKIVFWFYVSSLASVNVMVISEHDRKIFQIIKKLKVSYVPPILNFNSVFSVVPEKNTVIFFSGKAFVSILAAEYIIHIAHELPEIHFSITGFIPPKLKVKDIPGNVTLNGYLGPNDFYTLLDRSSVVILPLISGSGFQTKMAEALSRGKPIITTSVISEEFPELLNGVHVLIEDDPVGFISKIRILTNDIELQSKLSRNALEYYNTHLSKELALKLHLEYFSNILNKR